MAETVDQLFEALARLTKQVPWLAERGGGGGTSRKWGGIERYKNLKVFDGSLKDDEEWWSSSGASRVQRT